MISLGYICICNPGFIPTQDRRSCLDGRQGTCFTSLSRDGQCSNPMAFQLSREIFKNLLESFILELYLHFLLHNFNSKLDIYH